MSSESIHPSAIIGPDVTLADDVFVGPYAVIKGKVTIGGGTRIESHVVIGSDNGVVEIGKRNHIFSGAMIGGPPQDLKYEGEPTKLVIGDGNMIREFVTINIGTVTGTGVTMIGDGNLLMAYVHIAHDCHIGSHIAIANTSNFAGHVTVEDNVRIGGVCAFNQFIRIGKYSFVTGDSAVNKDVMPFTIAQGKYAVSRAANTIGLERAGFSKEHVDSIYKAVRILTKGNRTIEEALQEIESSVAPNEHVAYLVNFVKSSQRGVAR